MNLEERFTNWFIFPIHVHGRYGATASYIAEK